MPWPSTTISVWAQGFIHLRSQFIPSIQDAICPEPHPKTFSCNTKKSFLTFLKISYCNNNKLYWRSWYWAQITVILPLTTFTNHKNNWHIRKLCQIPLPAVYPGDFNTQLSDMFLQGCEPSHSPDPIGTPQAVSVYEKIIKNWHTTGCRLGNSSDQMPLF